MRSNISVIQRVFLENQIACYYVSFDKCIDFGGNCVVLHVLILSVFSICFHLDRDFFFPIDG